MPAISVIVPVFKVEPYLRRCIDSIRLQSYNDFELVLVDDGSPDRCGHICDTYAAEDSRIIVIHQKNAGLSAARNAGIAWAFKHSNSEWITFIDSDDWVHPRYLELLVEANRSQRTNISIGIGKWTKGEELESIDQATITRWHTRDYYRAETVNATVAWGKLYKKSCFENIRYPVGKIHEDEFVTYRILFEQPYVTVIKEPIYAYFQNQEGIMLSRWSVRHLDCLEGLSEQVVYFENTGDTELAKQRYNVYVRTLIGYKDIIYSDNKMSKEERRKYNRKLKNELRKSLFKNKHYRWLSLKADRPVFANAFSGLDIARRGWLKIKHGILKK